MKELWKTTIVVWSDKEPFNWEITDIAHDAMDGDSFCSRQHTVLVEDAEADPDWRATDFFDCFDDDLLESTDQRKLARD